MNIPHIDIPFADLNEIKTYIDTENNFHSTFFSIDFLDIISKIKIMNAACKSE